MCTRAHALPRRCTPVLSLTSVTSPAQLIKETRGTASSNVGVRVVTKPEGDYPIFVIHLVKGDRGERVGGFVWEGRVPGGQPAGAGVAASWGSKGWGPAGDIHARTTEGRDTLGKGGNPGSSLQELGLLSPGEARVGLELELELDSRPRRRHNSRAIFSTAIDKTLPNPSYALSAYGVGPPGFYRPSSKTGLQKAVNSFKRCACPARPQRPRPCSRRAK